MFYSRKLSLLYIACPKTGSTSIERFLKEIDPKGETHSITLENKKILSNDVFSGAVGHARGWEIKEAIGNKEYSKLEVFGMVRHPYDKLISSYYYAKSQSILDVLKWKGQNKLFLRKLKGVVSHSLPKILPINIWIFLYPMKIGYDYYYDKKGDRIVKYLGRTDYLNEDLKLILEEIGIKNNLTIPHINKSEHKDRKHYFNNKIIKKYLDKKYNRDLKLYDLVEDEMIQLRNKNL